MRVSKNQLNAHFAASAAVVGAAAMMGSEANAAVVYSGPMNMAIPVNIDGVYINVVTGATGSAAADVSGWDINPYSGTALTWYAPSAPAASHGAVRNAPGGAGSTTVDNLALGFVVGPTLPSGAATSFGNGGSETAATSATKFNLSSDANFVGFRFFNEATSAVHYGFMQLHLGASMIDASRSILGIWYEGAAATAIAVNPIPAPGAIALLGLAGLISKRRR